MERQQSKPTGRVLGTIVDGVDEESSLEDFISARFDVIVSELSQV